MGTGGSSLEDIVDIEESLAPLKMPSEIHCRGRPIIFNVDTDTHLKMNRQCRAVKQKHLRFSSILVSHGIRAVADCNLPMMHRQRTGGKPCLTAFANCPKLA